jgi:hypothetical protein
MLRKTFSSAFAEFSDDIESFVGAALNGDDSYGCCAGFYFQLRLAVSGYLKCGNRKLGGQFLDVLLETLGELFFGVRSESHSDILLK